MDEPTVVDLVRTITEQIRAHQLGASGPPAREFALAITALEEVQMRYTRGRAMQLDRFAPADLDRD